MRSTFQQLAALSEAAPVVPQLAKSLRLAEQLQFDYCAFAERRETKDFARDLMDLETQREIITH